TSRSHSLLQAPRRKTALPVLTAWCLLVTAPMMSIHRAQALTTDPSGAGPQASSTSPGAPDSAGVSPTPKGDHRHAGHTHRLRRVTPQFGPPGSSDPVPIAGGDFIPGFGIIHNFLSGPSDLTFEGLPLDGSDVEPNGITNFRGFIAQAYLEA